MNRLTTDTPRGITNKDDVIEACGAGDCFCELGALFAAATQAAELRARLAAYEDTGLEPEQCAKYAQAEKEGRLLVLPCKVGTLTYTPDPYYDLEEDGDPIQRFVVEGEDTYFETRDYLQRPISELGKTVFLTREDAEKALEGMKNDE